MIHLLRRRARPRTAAEWFAARRGRADARHDRQFQEWLAEHPSHGEEYALCEIAWAVSGEAAAGMPEPRRSAHAPAAFRRLAATATLAVAAGGAIAWFWPLTAQTWATAPGEQRTVMLEDGSRITLNTRTRVAVRFSRHARDVVLEDGEAFFEVTKDPSRPFTVRTSLGSARVVGTRFDVYIEERRLAVTTEQGSVFVNGAAPGRGVLVDAGRQAELRAGSPLPIVRPADLASALNWRAQRLEADNVPLGSVLREFSRYTRGPVRAETAEIAAVRVTAVLRTGDIEALEATLRGALGLDIQRRGDEFVVVTAKSEQSAPR